MQSLLLLMLTSYPMALSYVPVAAVTIPQAVIPIQSPPRALSSNSPVPNLTPEANG